MRRIGSVVSSLWIQAVVAYQPRKIRNVTQRDHYELTVPITDRIVVRRLAT
jgi:hypothetical protein